MTISATTQGIKPGVCLSTNRPAAPFDGQVIYMTDVDQTAVWDGSQWTVLAPIAGGRNAIINGDFKVWQRGTSFSAVSPGAYTADRWTNSYGAVTSNITRETDVPSKDFSYSLKFAAPSSFSSTEYVLRTWLEIQNVKRFVGKSVTLSFWIKSSKTAVKCRVAAYQSTGGADNQNPVTVVANTWTKVSFTSTAFSGVTAWSGADNTSGCFVDVGFDNSQSYTSSDYFMVAGIQLEAGAVATPFEFEDYSQTLEKCQRYYFRFANGASETPWVLAYARSTTVLDAVLQFPVQMRVAPTAIEFSSIGALQPTLVLTAVSALTFISPSPHTANLVATTTGLTQYRTYFISNNGSGYIAFTAEL